MTATEAKELEARIQKRIQNEREYERINSEIALKVYEILKSEGVTISQGRDILEIVSQKIDGAERRAKLD